MSRSSMQTGIRRLRERLAAQRGREDSDEQLLEAFRSRRDDSAFAALVRRHGPMVLHVCRRVLGHQQDAEDAFQATFLVLARDLASLRKTTALASWLHGIAYRTARKAQRAAARRRKYEDQTPPRSPVDPSGELLWREVRTLLDEEIAGLPREYRSVFVLCCLENLSQAETGRRLGLKERTVSSRLAEARKRLARRLARRGVGLTALLGAAALASPPASALPAALLSTTIEAAVAMAAREGMGGVVLLSKTKIATALVLVASVLGGAGVWLGAEPQATVAPAVAKADDKPATATPQREAAKTLEIQGRVLGIDGKPKAGAKLLLLDKDGLVKQLGDSAADGRFTVVVPKELKGGLWPALLAQSGDAGIDFISLAGWEPAKPVELRLVKDHAIRGRIINTEGKPVAGVRVGVLSIDVYPNNSLDSFLTRWKKRPFNQGPPEADKLLWFRAAPLLTATTDDEGRFAISGVGAERFAELDLQGAGIAHTRLAIVNRGGFDAKPYNQASLDNIPKGEEAIAFRMLLYTPDVSVVAEPEKVIRGTVKDTDSGKGLPNVGVRLERIDDAAERGGGEARTDSRGHYEIHGVRKAKAYRLEIASDSTTGYLACQLRVADSTVGYSPLTADIRLKKGVIVTGKVIDRATGRSVPGRAEAAVLFENPFIKDYPEFNLSSFGKYHYTAVDGTFRVATIPGPVLLMGGSDESRSTGDFLDDLKYKLPKPDEKYPQYFHKASDGARTEYYPFGGGSAIVDGGFCKVLDIKPGTAIVHQDILLERASALEVKIREVEGRPVSGVWATDFASTRFTAPLWVKEASCSVYSLEARKPRLLVFLEPKKKLVGSMALTGEEKAPLVMKLGSTGAIKGRLLDADGKPLAGVVVDVAYRHYAAGQIHQILHAAKQIVTDANGAFTLDELIPELKFELSVRRGKRRFERTAKPAETTIEIKPGERRDVGAIKMKPASEKADE